jgi:small subunit ribosomal protein S16
LTEPDRSSKKRRFFPQNDQASYMVTIRLARSGAKKSPFYHIVVTDSRTCRDGRFLESLGTYDPSRDAAFKLDRTRLAYWRGVGAQPSPTVTKILKKFPAPADAAPAAK